MPTGTGTNGGRGWVGFVHTFTHPTTYITTCQALYNKNLICLYFFVPKTPNFRPFSHRLLSHIRITSSTQPTNRKTSYKNSCCQFYNFQLQQRSAKPFLLYHTRIRLFCLTFCLLICYSFNISPADWPQKLSYAGKKANKVGLRAKASSPKQQLLYTREKPIRYTRTQSLETHHIQGLFQLCIRTQLSFPCGATREGGSQIIMKRGGRENHIMAQQVLKNYTVVDEDYRGRQLGFRNFFEGDGSSLVEIRISSSSVANVSLEDFKKLLLAGEKLADLLAIEETNDDQATTDEA